MRTKPKASQTKTSHSSKAQTASPMPAQPDEASAGNRTRVYAGLFVGSLMVFGFAAWLAWDGKLGGWEYAWFARANHFSDSWAWIMGAITLLGSTWGAVASVVVVFLLKLYRLAWRLAFTILGAYGVAYIAKEVVGRARPEGLFDSLHVRAVEHGMGFPSGHATAITVIMLTLFPYLPRTARWIIVPAIILAVGVTRLYLGVHVPLDIVGGVALGTAAVAFVRILPNVVRKWLHVA